LENYRKPWPCHYVACLFVRWLTPCSDA
jgi:hypothetical protein